MIFWNVNPRDSGHRWPSRSEVLLFDLISTTQQMSRIYLCSHVFIAEKIKVVVLKVSKNGSILSGLKPSSCSNDVSPNKILWIFNEFQQKIKIKSKAWVSHCVVKLIPLCKNNGKISQKNTFQRKIACFKSSVYI